MDLVKLLCGEHNPAAVMGIVLGVLAIAYAMQKLENRRNAQKDKELQK
jgi:hypothetical protein